MNQITKGKKMIVGAIVLVAFMFVNIQVSIDDASKSDINLFGLAASIFAPAAVATSSVPEECGPGADPSSSYSGNWDLHEGGCWLPPEPRTCVVCNYM